MARKSRPSQKQPNCSTHYNGSITRFEQANPLEIMAQDWLVQGLIQASCLTVIEGRKGTGKSSLLATIAATMTGGPVMPGWVGPTQGNVVWCGSEEDWYSMVMPRLKRAGCNLALIFRPRPKLADGKTQKIVLPDHIDDIRKDLALLRCKLLVLDPFISLMSASLDVRIEQQARLYLEPLASLCWDLDITCLLTRHIRKGISGDLREAGLGNVAVANTARGLIRCDEHPHEHGNYVMSAITCSGAKRLAPQVYSLNYDTPDEAPVTWHGTAGIDPEAIAEGRGSEAERDEWADADHLLVTLIADGWVRVSALESLAEKGGITPRMLRRAKARLKVPSRQRLVGTEHFWEWGVPNGGWPASLLPKEEGGGGTRTQERLGAPEGSEPPETPPKRSRHPRRPRARVPPPTRPNNATAKEVPNDTPPD